MRVSKWGNSLAIRLPAAMVEILGLKVGDDIEIDVAGSKKFVVQRSASNREVLERLRKYRGLLPADFRFDRLKAYGDRG